MNDIREFLELQKSELEKRLKEPYIERDTKLAIGFKDNLIRVIIGPRRAGKSFFVLHWLKKNAKFGYINFDDEKLSSVENFNELIVAVDSLYGARNFLSWTKYKTWTSGN